MEATSKWTYRLAAILFTSLGCSAPDAGFDQTMLSVNALSGSPTIVSLTFDDSCADQYVALPLLAEHDMKATFYVNWPRLGLSGDWLSVEQAQDLVSTGHEIGGHTLNHADLETWPADVVRREVCNDRAALMELGFAPRSFAFPFGSPKLSDPAAPFVEAIVGECGYNSARGTGELRIGSLCPTCPIAESVPPADTYHIRGSQSIHRTTTLESIKERVVQAEEHGGGWVPLVFHHVCDGCNEYSISPALFAELLDWLAPRATGGTVVRTVGEVMGGELQPAVHAPPPSPGAPGSNLIFNPSLERDDDNNGVPDCWQPGGVGSSTARFEMSTDAADGEIAEQITVTDFVSGARRLVTRQDQGLCAPNVHPGHSYRMTTLYRSTVPARFIAYYANSSNKWSVFAQSGWLDARSEYAEAQWVLPTLPADATRVSVGMSIFANGQLMLDAFTLRDNDLTPPTVQILAPSTDLPSSRTIALAARAHDEGGLYSVEFLLNGQKVAGDVERHGDVFVIHWNSSQFAGGELELEARATDLAGNTSVSTSRFAVDATYSGNGHLPVPWMACNGDACTSTWSPRSALLELGAVVDDNSTLCAIRYSLSGADPLLHGEIYSGPITLTSSADVRVVAISCQGTPSSTLASMLQIDTTPPTNVGLVSPLNGSVASGTTPIVVNPTDHIALVRFFLDGIQLGTRKTAPWRWNWNASTVASGTHRIHVVVEDLAGNATTSDGIEVAVP